MGRKRQAMRPGKNTRKLNSWPQPPALPPTLPPLPNLSISEPVYLDIPPDNPPPQVKTNTKYQESDSDSESAQWSDYTLSDSFSQTKMVDNNSCQQTLHTKSESTKSENDTIANNDIVESKKKVNDTIADNNIVESNYYISSESENEKKIPKIILSSESENEKERPKIILSSESENEKERPKIILRPKAENEKERPKLILKPKAKINLKPKVVLLPNDVTSEPDSDEIRLVDSIKRHFNPAKIRSNSSDSESLSWSKSDSINRHCNPAKIRSNSSDSESLSWSKSLK